MRDPLVFGPKERTNQYLSNDSPHGFVEDGREWPTIEHYMMASLFVGEKYDALKEKIRIAPRPRKAHLLADANRSHWRDDWTEVRDEIMMHALRLKFSSRELTMKLINTGHRELVCLDVTEHYWSAGRDGSGTNRLGQLLEQLRAELSVIA